MSAGNPQESMPFFETAKAATKRALEDAGANFKTAGHWLWPEKDIERAASDLRAALNENRNEELDTEQHILIANKTQRYHYVHYVCHRTSHGQPPLVTPEERKAAITAAMQAKAGELRKLLDEIERLGTPA